MNFQELKNAVWERWQDKSKTLEAMLPAVVNEAVQIAAEEADIPSLRIFGTVTTSLIHPYQTMPTGFSGKLRFIGHTYGKISIVALEELLSDYPLLDEIGDVHIIAVSGSILYYQGTPTVAAVLPILYFQNPPTLTTDIGIPDCIPEFLHREVIVTKAAAIGFDLIEDGTEGSKPNTSACLGEYAIGLNKLREYIGKRKTHMTRSVWTY